jgi:hypothetical protein
MLVCTHADTDTAMQPTTASMLLLPLRSTGIAVDKVTGYVYVGDELTGGSLFRFVPTTYGNLSAGTLYCIKVRAHMARHFGELLMTALQHVSHVYRDQSTEQLRGSELSAYCHYCCYCCWA